MRGDWIIRNIAVPSIAVMIGLSLLGPGAAPTSSHADLLLINAKIITMDKQHSVSGALAIRGDRIEWVGASDQAKTLFADAAQIIDLGGGTVLPGINDAHVHLQSLGESFLKLNLKGIETPEAAVRAVGDRAAKVLGGAMDPGVGLGRGRVGRSLSGKRRIEPGRAR
jgi:predicted amidohydrolase YtcJ